MKLENSYPDAYKRINKFIKARKIILIIYLIILIAAFVINLSIGGRLWFIYVLGGELITYYAFLNKPLIDNMFMKRLVFLLVVIILYLYSIDLVNTTNWSYKVIDILSFSLLILELLFFFINYEHHKNKIILMFFTSIFSCVFCFFAIIGIIHINWAIIVTGSLGLFTLILLFTFYYKVTKLELQKYFSLK